MGCMTCVGCHWSLAMSSVDVTVFCDDVAICNSPAVVCAGPRMKTLAPLMALDELEPIKNFHERLILSGPFWPALCVLK